jgi:hypothetical protein
MVGWGSVVPPGLESFLPVFPALKRWANFFSPLRGWILDFVHRIARKTFTVKMLNSRTSNSELELWDCETLKP